MGSGNNELEKKLWESADKLRANSSLSSSGYSRPVLGLIFLRYAERRFAKAEKELVGKGSKRRTVGPPDYQALGMSYLPIVDQKQQNDNE